MTGLYPKLPQEMEVGWEEGLLEVGCNRAKNKSGETGIKGLGPHQTVEVGWEEGFRSCKQPALS